MSIKIKAHILCQRIGTELGEPAVFPSHHLAYKEMESRFSEALAEYNEGGYLKEETAIYGDSAIIVTNGDWEEWTITEGELEISDLQSFATAFENFLGNYSTKFEQVITKVPEALEMATNLSESLSELKKLLALALPDTATNND